MIRRPFTPLPSPPRDRRFRPLGPALILLTVACVWLTSCQSSTSVSPTYRPRPMRPQPALSQQSVQPPAKPARSVLPALTSVRAEPVVRVRIARSQGRVDVSSASGLLIAPADLPVTASSRRYPAAVAITVQQGSFLITDTQRKTLRWTVPALSLSSVSTGSPLIYEGKPYPGTITLVAVSGQQNPLAQRIDVVNHVGMESYLPGVIERELYGSWDPAAFRAAAIAGRSYAIFESSLNTDKHYDLESTTASQAYSGRATNPKALDAVSQTRGMLLAYQGRVVPAFYSSACGGSGQDAVTAFTWLAGLPDIEPLRARNHGSYCSGSNKFRWGPITRSKAALAMRLQAWGEREEHPIKALRGIRDIRVTKLNAVGRPASFTVTDTAGLMYRLGPEQFRFACNASAPQLGAVPQGQSLYSSHVQVAVGPTSVTFSQGQGYGHGVGLCQFGAQALATSGYNAYSILQFYYPGSQVVRAYR